MQHVELYEAALNSARASKLTLLLVGIIGRREEHEQDGQQFHIRRLGQTAYLIDRRLRERNDRDTQQ